MTGAKIIRKSSACVELRPDIVLLSGGTDGGTITHLVELAELLIAADPRPRFGTMNLPVIFAGNKDAREEIKRLLGERFDLQIVDNLRPTLDRKTSVPPAKRFTAVSGTCDASRRRATPN